MGSKPCGKESMNTQSEIEQTLFEGIELLQNRRIKHGDKYANVYKSFGNSLMGLFPNGIHIEADDFDSATKLGVIVQIITKLSRYCASLGDGGHEDSALDLTNYSAMLKSLTLPFPEEDKKEC
jgi:hypothetical protein